MLIAFPLQQWLHAGPQRYATRAVCLSCLSVCLSFCTETHKVPNVPQTAIGTEESMTNSQHLELLIVTVLQRSTQKQNAATRKQVLLPRRRTSR